MDYIFICCPVCNFSCSYKDVEIYFYKRKSKHSKDDVRAWYTKCKECSKNYRKRYWAKNRENLLSKRREERNKNRTKHNEQSLQSRWNRLTEDQRVSLTEKRRIRKLSEQDKFIYYKVRAWKKQAKIRHIEFKLTEEDIRSLIKIQNNKCYYTGLDLIYTTNNIELISLDRIDSGKSYTIDNVVLCCSIINLMKLDLPASEFRHYCKMVYKLAYIKQST